MRDVGEISISESDAPGGVRSDIIHFNLDLHDEQVDKVLNWVNWARSIWQRGRAGSVSAFIRHSTN